MDANAVKGTRTSAKRVFTRKRNLLMQSMDDELDPEIVNERFEEVKTAWGTVQNSHEELVKVSGFPEDGEIDEWIIELEGIYQELEIRKLRYLKKWKENELKLEEEVRDNFMHKAETSRINESNENILKAGRAREVQLSLFKNQADFLTQVLEEGVSASHPMEVAASAHVSLLCFFDRAEKSHIAFLQWLPGTGDPGDANWLVPLQDILNELTQKFYALKTSFEKTLANTQIFVPRGLKMERMSLPKFDGNLRKYNRFKSDFLKYVLPSIERDSAAYVLKSCLSEAPKGIVESLDDDLDKMWDRLDERYGRPTKVADLIISDIKKQRMIKDGDDKDFVRFVDVIESGYWDLERLGLGGEISNSIVLSLIEEKLPRAIKHDWAKQINKRSSNVNESEKFPSFLEFLTEQRKIVEYENSDVRFTPKSELTDPGARCWLHKTNSHGITSCITFQNMSYEQKVNNIKSSGACWCCLEMGHTSSSCNNKGICGENNCTKTHHPLIHNEEMKGNTSKLSSLNSNCLLQIMNIRSPKCNKPLNVLWDGGSTISLITLRKAKELKLKGKPIELAMCKVGGKIERVPSFVYNLPLMDAQSNVIYFKVFGFEKISSNIDPLNLGRIAKMFKIDENKLQRSKGEIDVLIGFEYAGFHPKTISNIDHLVLMKSRFGHCLGGSHPTLKENADTIARNVSINLLKGETLEDFFVAESLGQGQMRCGNCGDECRIENKQCTIQERRELSMIERGLTFDGSVWTASYPWNCDPLKLPNNKSVALACLSSTEKRLQKKPDIAILYAAQIEEMLENGVARKLTRNEIHNYKGPIHYLAHHEVLKNSSSTPCRIVFNSSAKYLNVSLNDWWVKGPDLMNNLVGVLIRFRENYFAAVGDIKRMYHSVRISETDQHVHRFLWRFLDPKRVIEEFVITRVSFGDKPSGAIATVALRKTALMSLNEHPEAVKTIIRNSYVDDILDSFATKEEAKSTIKVIEKILEKGSFQMKSWVFSAEAEGHNFVIKDQNMNNRTANIEKGVTDHPKVLGLIWDSHADVFRFAVVATADFDAKKEAQKTDCRIKNNKLSRKDQNFSKRILLSKVNSIFDPLGLAAPLIVKAKIMMRRIWVHEPKLNWDDIIPDYMAKEWEELFTELPKMNEVKFPRCIKPKSFEDLKEPELIIFSDASESAFGCCAYVRWEVGENVFKSTLIIAKSRIAPTKMTTIVRLELNAAVLAVRIKKFLLDECRLKFTRTFFLIDSKVVLGLINHESHSYHTYVGVRVGEIHEMSDCNDWYWVKSRDNIADLLTRGANANVLDTCSEWQNGPPFLELPASRWPAEQPKLHLDTLPEVKSNVYLNEAVEKDTLVGRIGIHKYSHFQKLLRVTARVLLCYEQKPKFSFKNACLALEFVDLQRAEKFWISDAQAVLGDLKKFSRLAPKVRDNIVIVGTRCEAWLENSYNNNELVLLPYNHDLSKLYANYIHSIQHLGVASTICKIRNRFWIINITRLVKTIVNNCVNCRKKRRLLETQIMAPLPIGRLKPAPAWHTTHMDYFGPFPLKGEVNKRTRAKGFGIIFTCALTRAIHLDVSSNYNADGFKQVLRRFIAIRGYPGKFVSDRGSQLVAVSKELKNLIKNLNWEEIKAFGVENGVNWDFSPPTAPWMNGCAESMIKGVKSTMKHVIGSHCLSFPEMQTVLFEIANLVNERPIGKHPDNPNEGTYLSPNELLLGRATARVPSGPFKEYTNIRQRHEFLQSLVNAYWKKWIRVYFPTLIVRQKWHTARRNVKVDDVVLVQDSNLLRGQWVMGRVKKVFPGADGYVRKCQIACHTPSENTKDYLPCKVLERPTNKLVVLIAADETKDN